MATDPRERRGREIQEAIRHVLEESWDPIGLFPGGPAGEYDDYIGPIYRLLADQAGEPVLVRYLMGQEEVLLGAPTRITPRIADAARRLLDLDVSLASRK